MDASDLFDSESISSVHSSARVDKSVKSRALTAAEAEKKRLARNQDTKMRMRVRREALKAQRRAIANAYEAIDDDAELSELARTIAAEEAAVPAPVAPPVAPVALAAPVAPPVAPVAAAAAAVDAAAVAAAAVAAAAAASSESDEYEYVNIRTAEMIFNSIRHAATIGDVEGIWSSMLDAASNKKKVAKQRLYAEEKEEDAYRELCEDMHPHPDKHELRVLHGKFIVCTELTDQLRNQEKDLGRLQVKGAEAFVQATRIHEIVKSGL